MDLNVKCKPVKPLEDDIEESLWDIGLDEEFFNTLPKAQSIKEEIEKPDFIRI